MWGFGTSISSMSQTQAGKIISPARRARTTASPTSLRATSGQPPKKSIQFNPVVTIIPDATVPVEAGSATVPVEAVAATVPVEAGSATVPVEAGSATVPVNLEITDVFQNPDEKLLHLT